MQERDEEHEIKEMAKVALGFSSQCEPSGNTTNPKQLICRFFAFSSLPFKRRDGRDESSHGYLCIGVMDEKGSHTLTPTSSGESCMAGLTNSET